MIIDLRTYTLRVGAAREFLDLYARKGLDIQRQHLGAPLAYCTAESGDLNDVVHIWPYADAAERQRRRAALQADPRWMAYCREAASLGQVVRQSNVLLRSVDFSVFGASSAAPASEGGSR